MRIRIDLHLSFGKDEPEPEDRYADHTGTHHAVGFTTERDGRIEDVL